MTQHFNPPPNWPTPPNGWFPDDGWQPDPSWPDPPPGWKLWIYEGNEPKAMDARDGYVQRSAASPAALSNSSIDNSVMPKPEWLYGILSAGLILPTVGAYYLDQQIGYHSNPVVSLLYGYFVHLTVWVYAAAVAALFARSSVRRVGSLAVALAAIVAFSIMSLTRVVSLWDYVDLVENGGRAISVVALLLMVTAWGIARRRNNAWIVGLLPSAAIIVLFDYLVLSSISIGYVDFIDTNDPLAFLGYWAVDVSRFVACCLVCWGCDALGRAVASSQR